MKGGPQKKYSEHEIIEGIKNKEKTIFEFIYNELWPQLKNMLKGSEEQVKDNFQETMIEVWLYIKAGKYKEGNIKGFITTVSKNIWKKKFRDNRIEKGKVPLNNKMQDQSVEEFNLKVLHEKQYEIVINKLKELDEKCQKFLTMYYFQRKSYKQIGAEMGIKENNAKQRCFVCKEKLKELSMGDLEFVTYYDEFKR